MSQPPTARRRHAGFAVQCLLACACAVGALAAAFPGHYRGIWRSDDFEYVSVARNIWRGAGFATQHLLPVDLRQFDGAPHAEYIHPPGLATAIAASFYTFGVRDAAAVIPSAVGFVWLVGATFALTWRLAGARAAWLAAVAVACHPHLSTYAWQALAESPATACAVTAAACLTSRRAGAALGAGALLATAQLFRGNLALALPAYAWAARYVWARPAATAHPHATIQRLALLIVGFIPALAWLAWYTASVGPQLLTQYGLQAYSAPYPALDVARMLEPPSAWQFAKEYPGALAAKVLLHWAKAPLNVARALGWPLLGIGLLAWVAHRRRLGVPRAAWVGRLWLWSTGLSILGLAFFQMIPRHYLVFVPLAAAFVAIQLAQPSSLRLWRLALILAILGGVAQWTRAAPSNALRPLEDFLDARVHAHATVGSDFSEVALWRADRTGVWLPVTVSEFQELDKRVPINAVLLTSLRTPTWHSSWQRVWSGQSPLPGFVLDARYASDSLDAKLYKRVAPRGIQPP